MFIIHFFPAILLNSFTKLPLKPHFGALDLGISASFFRHFEGLKSQKSPQK